MSNNQNTQVVIFITVVASFLVGTFAIFGGFPIVQDTVNLPVVATPVEEKSYTTEGLGISFEYSEKYLLIEREVGNGERRHYSILLVEDNETTRRLLSGELVGELPPSINIDIYQNDLDDYSAEDWIKNTNTSNYKLSPDGKIYKDSVDGLDAYIYKYSGLYETYNVVVKGKNNIYAFGVSYLEMEDQIINDFNKLIETVRLEK